MDTPATFLSALSARGITLEADGERLLVSAPAGVLTDADRGRIRVHKSELLALVARCPGCKRPLRDGRCWRCHYRPCSGCRRDTGSAFIEMCDPCGQREAV